MKNTILLFSNMKEPIDELDDEDAGKLFKAILAYQNGDEVKLQGLLKVVFLQIKQQIDYNNERYAETSKKRSEARKAWLLKQQTSTNDNKTQQNPTNENNTHLYDNDNDNGNENENESENVIENENGNDNGNENENVCSSNIYNNIGHAGAEERQAAALKFRGKHQNVLLSDDQIEDLKANYPKLYKAKIEYLSEWKKKNPTFQGNDYALLSKFLYEDELAMQAKAESQKNEKPQKSKKTNPEQYEYELGAIKV